MQKILLLLFFAVQGLEQGLAQGTAPTGTAPTDAPLTLQDEVEARVNRHLSHYEVMDNLTVLDTTGAEYSMIAVTKLVATQAAMEYLTHSQEARELLNPADAGKEQGQPSGWGALFLMLMGAGLGVALALVLFGHYC